MSTFNEVFQRMSILEILFAGIGFAWLVFAIIFGLTISGTLFVVFTFIALIFFVLSASFFQYNEKQNRKLVALVLVHESISVKDASNLLGQSPKRLIKNYISILDTDNKDKIRYDPSTLEFFTVSIAEPSEETDKPSFESIANTPKQNNSKTDCSYCGYENKAKAVFCASCGASLEK